jgi:hypothetical protein
MRKASPPLTTATIIVASLVAGLSVWSPSWAQEINSENAILEKLDSLVEQLGLIASRTNSYQSAADSSSFALQALGMENPQCLDNYTSWPQSSTFSAGGPWSTELIFSGNYSHEITNQFTDLNGDGLIDHIFLRNAGQLYSTNRTSACVLLNNGNGWDLAYRCVATANSSGATYYGDCAQL